MTFEGAFYKVPRVRMTPKPVQKPHPPLWTAAVSPDTYTLAAKRGLKILTSPAFTPLDILGAFTSKRIVGPSNLTVLAFTHSMFTRDLRGIGGSR